MLEFDLVLFLTEKNKYGTYRSFEKEREKRMSAWFKDAMSGLFLMTFIVVSFGMADAACLVMGS